MFATLVRRTSHATALLLAALGLPASLLAAPGTQPPAAATHTAAQPGHARTQGVPPYRRNIAAIAKGGKRPVTPFDRVILPKIKAEQAAARASAGKPGSNAGASAAWMQYKPSTDLASPSGLPVNFPGFLQPAWFYVNGTADTVDTFITLTADVNKDGKPDLVTIQVDGTVNVLLNTGTGLPTNGPSSINSSTATYAPTIFSGSAVDLNNDGYPDLELVDFYQGMVYTLMNNGDGTFAPATQIALALPSGNSIGFEEEVFGGDVLFANVTGHATPDMIVVSGQVPTSFRTVISVQVFEGVGDGSFTAQATTVQSQTLANTYLYGSFHSVKAADMNGDGKLDLVYPVTGISFINNVSGVTFSYNYVLTGDNLGDFSSLPVVSDTSVGAFVTDQRSLTLTSYVGNLGDGNTPGVVAIGYPGASYSQLSNGDGTLQAPVALASLTDEGFGGFEWVNLADVNGDGKVDLVGEGQGYFSIYNGNGDGTFSASANAQYVATYGEVLSAQPADFNGDGKVDIVSVSASGDAGVFLGTGGGLFAGAPLVAPPTDAAEGDASILAANLAGHGYSDVLLYDTNGEATDLVTGINDGHGNFTYVTALSSTLLGAISWEFVYPFTVDINNDGKQDMLISADNGLYYALSNGDGTFAAPAALPLGGNLGCAPGNGAVGDINGDGKPDLVVLLGSCESGDFTNGGYFTLLNTGNGTYTPAYTSYFTGQYLVSLADMNNDGNLDMVWLDMSEGDYVDIIPGNGDGTFNTANDTEIAEVSDVYSVLTGDYDGDGNQDLALMGNYNGYGVNLLKGHGDFTFTPGASFLPGTVVEGAQYTDFNNDGRPDLALNISPSSAPYLGFAYSVNLGGAFSDPTLVLSSYIENDGSVIIADFNGDGSLDALATSFAVNGIFYNTGAVVLNLAASASSATQDSPVTLTATLAPSLNSVPATGTVTFYDNGVAIGTVPVSGNAAMLTLSTLAVGSNAITAVYSGDANYNSASSTASVNGTANVGVTALPAAFTMTAATGSSLDLTVGQTGTATFTVTGNATFSGAITFACSNVPKGTSCTVLPSMLTLSGGQTATIGVVLDTTAPNNHYDASNFIPTWMRTTGGITLAGGLLLLLPSRRRRNLWPVLLFASLGLGAALSLSGCSHKYSGTPAGTYNINVTATAGSLTQTGTIALTIHQ